MTILRCVGCGHDPACGWASITIDDIERFYCDADDHSCYKGEWPPLLAGVEESA